MEGNKNDKDIPWLTVIFDQTPTWSKGKYGNRFSGGSDGGDEGSASGEVLG